MCKGGGCRHVRLLLAWRCSLVLFICMLGEVAVMCALLLVGVCCLTQRECLFNELVHNSKLQENLDYPSRAGVGKLGSERHLPL